MAIHDPYVFSSHDSSGDIDLYDFQESIMNGLLHYINQIFLIEKPDVKAIAKEMGISEPTLYRIRNCDIQDYHYLTQIIQLAKILKVKGKVVFELQR